MIPLKGLATATLIAATVPFAAEAGTFTTLYTFTGKADGSGPYGSIVYVHGSLYGVTANNNGTAFKFDLTTNRLKTIHAFKGGSDGATPTGGVVYNNGMLYGTTVQGGGGTCSGYNGCGTVFSIDLGTGSETILCVFPVHNVQNEPNGLLYQAGMLYGTTEAGGADGAGSVFAVSPTNGSYTTLYSFAAGADGAGPNPQLLYHDGLIYGTTQFGGGGQHCYGGGCGTVFAVNPMTDAENIVHAFKRKEGDTPFSNLVYYDGKFIGSTLVGGQRGCKNGCGLTYELHATTGKERVLIFNNAYAEDPYGMTMQGGIDYETLENEGGYGELVEFSPKTKTSTVLYTFSGGTAGGHPMAPLIYENGVFYGSTYGGDRGDNGTLFSYAP